MRCKNCGWPNKPDAKNCVKCHAPLQADNDDALESIVMDGDSTGKSLNKTVLEDEYFGVSRQRLNPTKPEEEMNEPKVCPKCGYPLRPGSDKCPNCQYDLSRSSTDKKDYSDREHNNSSGDSELRPTRLANGKSKGKFSGTVNPYTMNMEIEPSFVLKPIKRMNERHDLDEQEYEGKEVVLNRENTESKNPSITSRQQAVVSHVDGHWYIEDKSDQKTTFVQAAHKVELHDGDIILLGNRLFEFHE